MTSQTRIRVPGTQGANRFKKTGKPWKTMYKHLCQGVEVCRGVSRCHAWRQSTFGNTRRLAIKFSMIRVSRPSWQSNRLVTKGRLQDHSECDLRTNLGSTVGHSCRTMLPQRLNIYRPKGSGCMVPNPAPDPLGGTSQPMPTHGEGEPAQRRDPDPIG